MKEKELRMQSLFMLPTLLFLTASVIVLTWFFFIKYGNEANDLSVADAPYYQKPSLIVCTANQSDFSKLKESLAKSNCTKQNERQKPCDDVLRTFVRYHEDRYCVMLDNSNFISKLDTSSPDLVLDLDQSSKPQILTFWAGSLNETSPELVYSFKKWKNSDVSVAYNTKLRITHKNCIEENLEQPCPICPENSEAMNPPYACCYGRDMSAPTISTDTMCQTFRFEMSYSVTPRPRNTPKTSLIMTAVSSNVFITREYPLYKWNMLFTIVGGYISSFIEISTLNLLVYVTVKMAAKWKNRKGGGQKVTPKPNDHIEKTSE